MNQGDDFKWLDEWAKKQGQHLRNLTIKDIFEIIAVLFAGAGLYYLIVQSHEMQMATKVSQGQLEIMKRQMDDAEAQQRGWLKFEWFSVKRITNAPAGLTSQYLVACEVKNYGGSAVLDIHPVFKTLPDEFTNAQQRMNGHFVEIRNNKNPPEPTPEEGGRSLMPQGSTTYTMLTAPPHEQDVYTEVWISYRDIFGKAWVLGVGGTYRWKTDSFIPDFNYFNQSMGFTNTPDRSYFKMDFSSPEIPPPH